MKERERERERERENLNQTVRTKRKDRVAEERCKEITRREEWSDKRRMNVLIR